MASSPSRTRHRRISLIFWIFWTARSSSEFARGSGEALEFARGAKCSGLGCGIGGATFPMAEITGPTGLAAGVDISSAMVEAATKRANGRTAVEFKVGEACAMPYPDKFFDAARFGLLVLPDRVGAIHEMMKVVKPSGRIIVMDTELDSTAVYSKKLELTRKMTSIVAATMPNPNSARDLPVLARQTELKDVKAETFAISLQCKQRGWRNWLEKVRRCFGKLFARNFP